MKEYIFAILFIIQFSSVQSQPSWQQQRPLPTLNRLESSFFLNDNNGYAAGEKGTIIFTSNGGQQ